MLSGSGAMASSVKPQSQRSGKPSRLVRSIRRHFPAGLPPLLALTDPGRTPDPLDLALQLEPGSGLVYRHFGAGNRFGTAHALADACRTRRLLFLVANDPELALATGADGVHWPERCWREAWRWRGRFPLITMAAHSARAARRAGLAGADAVLVSPVFPSASRSAGQPLGTMRFRSIASASPVPAYALGGVRPGNAARIDGIGGLAAVEHALML